MQFRCLSETLARLEAVAQEMESVKFCYRVNAELAAGVREPTEHMDAPRAQAQLNNAVARLLKEWEAERAH